MTWRDELKNRPQAMDDPSVPKDLIANWPRPCEVCGAHWKLTPGQRFYIEHDGAAHRRGEKRLVA